MEEQVPRPWESQPRSAWAEHRDRWRTDRRLGAALLACVAVAALAAWLRSGTSSPSAALPAPAPTSSTTGSFVAPTGSTRPAPAIVVDVVGAVAHGGVVRLRSGARVGDAIAAAGGAAPGADLTRLNLAALLSDGTRVAVPIAGAAAPPVDPVAVTGSGAPGGAASGGANPSPAGPVNLNTADATQLDSLPGVGPTTAKAIVAEREQHGPFRSVNDLGRVRGIGDAKLAQLRDLVTV